MTAQLVGELELPLLQTIGLERFDAIAAIEDGPGRALVGPDGHGLLRHPPRGRDGHPARQALPFGPLHPARRCRACPSWRTAAGVASPSSPWRGTSTRACAGSSPPPSPRSRPIASAPPCGPCSASSSNASVGDGECEFVSDGVRALPHSHHLRAAGRAARGLEALLVVGHGHLPHLQRHVGTGSPAHRSGLRRADRLRERHDRGTSRRPPRRSAQRPDRGGRGGRSTLHRGDGDAGPGGAHGRHRHHAEPTGVQRGGLLRAARAVATPGPSNPSWRRVPSKSRCAISAPSGPPCASPPRT